MNSETNSHILIHKSCDGLEWSCQMRSFVLFRVLIELINTRGAQNVAHIISIVIV